MKFILKLLTSGLLDLLSGFVKTKNTSTVGLIDSIGDGKSPKPKTLKSEERTSNGINWTIVILFILVFVGGYFIPSPFQNKESSRVQATVHSEVLTSGVVDTVFIRVPAVVGMDSRVDNVRYVAELDLITIKAMPSYVENIVNVDTKELTGIIRATAYPYVIDDTLKIDLPIEWNLQLRPMEQISRVDTLRIIDSIFIEQDITLLAKPEVVAIGTSIVWLAILIILL